MKLNNIQEVCLSIIIISLVGIGIIFFSSVSNVDAQQQQENNVTTTNTTPTTTTIDSFNDCYTKNAVNFMMAGMLSPLQIDLTDPKMKNVISDMCNFYHEKTGKWIDIVTDKALANQHIKEFWDQYPLEEIPESVKQFWK
jgi:hypothetical protein